MSSTGSFLPIVACIGSILMTNVCAMVWCVIYMWITRLDYVTEQTCDEQLGKAGCKGQLTGGVKSESTKARDGHQFQAGATVREERKFKFRCWCDGSFTFEQTDNRLRVHDHIWVKSSTGCLGGEVWDPRQWEIPKSDAAASAWKKSQCLWAGPAALGAWSSGTGPASSNRVN